MRLIPSLALFVALFLALASTSGNAGTTDDATKREINQYVTLVSKYYEKPEPANALARFMRIDWPPFLLKMHIGKRQNFNQVAATFYSEIIRSNPDLAIPLARQAAAGGMKYHLLVVGRSIALSGVEDRKAALDILQRVYDQAPGSSPVGDLASDAIFANLSGAQPMDALHRPIIMPFDLDLMWAAFYATGNKAFVEKIARLLQAWMPQAQLKSRLAYLKPKAEIEEGPERSEMRLLITAQAPAVSLRANARSHRRVYEVLDNMALDRNGRAGNVAKQILQSLQ